MKEPELPLFVPPGPVARPELWHWADDPEALTAHWDAGGVVAIPTESSYGLAVDASNPAAVEAVFRIKRRPASQPLPVVAGAIEDLERLGVRLDLPELAPVLALWPAPLTVIVPLTRPVAAAMGAPSLAVRIPSHPRLCSLLRSLGRVVTATSANRSGDEPATTVEAISELLANSESIIVADGDLEGGAPSTIVKLRDGELVVLRQGRFPAAELVDRGCG